MEVAIRADASPEIGTGHLMRCLTLADALAREGAKSVFLCAPAAEPWRAMIESHGHCFTALPLHANDRNADATPPHAHWVPWGQPADAGAVLDAQDAMVDWLIVDHYAFDARWERAVRPRAKRILVIDDLADRDHDCDLLLDHNPQDPSVDRYRDRAPVGATRLIGPRYALLRPEFAAVRARHAQRVDWAQTDTVGRIVVFMGGTDAAGATLVALAALSEGDLLAIPVDVAIGGASPRLAPIREVAKARGNTVVHVDAPDIAELFAAADLAIGAGGVAALERCCVGLPTITMSVAANQEPGLEQLAAAGAVRHLGRLGDVNSVQLAAAVWQLLATPQMLTSMSQAASALVDGRGVDRVVAGLLNCEGELMVRHATMADAEVLYAWRNAPAVRAVSLDSNPIDYARHTEWLQTVLADPARVILVGVVSQELVGSVRYDIADGIATVSIVVSPRLQGRGIGGVLLAKGENYIRNNAVPVGELRAIIKPGNTASIRVFASAGFTPASEGQLKMIYLKSLR